jgi:hypothetical protein
VSTCTIFLHPDWARLSAAPRDSHEYKELSESAKQTVDISPSRPRLLELLGTVFIPGMLFLYAMIAFFNALYLLSRYRLFHSVLTGGRDLPCLIVVPISKIIDLALKGSSTAVAVTALIVAVSLFLICSIGRAYFSFAAFWLKSNSEYRI